MQEPRPEQQQLVQAPESAQGRGSLPQAEPRERALALQQDARRVVQEQAAARASARSRRFEPASEHEPPEEEAQVQQELASPQEQGEPARERAERVQCPASSRSATLQERPQSALAQGPERAQARVLEQERARPPQQACSTRAS